MRNTAFVRSLAVIGAGALLVSAPVTASAQDTDSVDTSVHNATVVSGSLSDSVEGSVSNSADGALASVGLGDLASSNGGPTCVAADPAGSMATTISVDMVTKEGESGTAHVLIEGGGLFTSVAQGTLHWENTTTGASGDQDFDALGGLDLRQKSFDIPTGVGHVTWDVDANEKGMPLSLAALGPVISTPYTTCSGEADIA